MFEKTSTTNEQLLGAGYWSLDDMRRMFPDILWQETTDAPETDVDGANYDADTKRRAWQGANRFHNQ